MLPVLCAKYSIFFYTLSTGVIRAALFESLILHHKKNKPEDYCNIPPASTVDIPSRWDPQGRAVQVLLSAQKKKRHTNACSPVDIPTGWEPRTKQQPTGLIAYPAAQGRAVSGCGSQRMLHALERRSHSADHGPSFASLFPPLAAVSSAAIPVRVKLKIPRANVAATTTVDIPSRWDPRANQSPTGALVAALRTAALFDSRMGQIKNALAQCAKAFL